MAVALACATGLHRLPDCDATAPAPPLPDAACLDSPDASSYVARLEGLLGRDAGPHLVRVALDARARVAGACIDRSAGRSQWDARRKVAHTFDAFRPYDPAPACLAGTRLELNRVGAALAEISALLDDCRREASVGADPGAAGARSASRRQFSCLERAQRRRGEIWVFTSSPRAVPLVFVETAQAGPRRAALLACTESHLTKEVEGQPKNTTRNARKTASCMRDQGWKPLGGPVPAPAVEAPAAPAR